MVPTEIEKPRKPPKQPKGDVCQMLRDVLKPGMSVIDVGAAPGDTTKVMLHAVGRAGSVLAIEPRHCPGLQKLQEPGWVTWIQAAASDETGTRTLSYADVQSSFWPGTIMRGITGTGDVPLVRLDDVAPEGVDVVKIDAQGHDLHVLKGATELLKRCPTWIVEVWPRGLELAGGSVHDLATFMTEAGFMPWWADGYPVEESSFLGAWVTSKQHHVNWIWRRP